MRTLYAMKEGGGAAIEIENILEAPSYNEKGYGIFWAIHEFSGARKKENLTQLNGFAIDIDEGTKQEQLALIKRGLYPTWLIESKRGFHIYWLFHTPLECIFNKPLEQEYRAIMLNRIIPFYNADKNAADIPRLLRAPYFFHLKDPNDKFLVFVKEENPVTYSWHQIVCFYPDIESEKTQNLHQKQAAKILNLPKGGKDYFNTIYQLNCKDALMLLSGHKTVNSDVYSFKQNTSGSIQILVNGKSTSCWVDKDGKIGSFDKGGPTIWQWLFWYLKDHKKVHAVIKEVLHV